MEDELMIGFTLKNVYIMIENKTNEIINYIVNLDIEDEMQTLHEHYINRKTANRKKGRQRTKEATEC
eukprot:UN03181